MTRRLFTMSIVPLAAEAAAPLRLSLEIVQPLGLRAMLRNTSKSTLTIVHDPFVQPSRLSLSVNGRAIKPADMREVERYSTTVSEDQMQRLEPGRSLEIFKALVDRRERGARIQWGPYEFDRLEGGVYSARVDWVAAYPKAWTGKLASNTVKITL